MKDKSTKLILSASRVKTYQQCKRKYYYNYIAKLPRKAWSHFDLGTLAHGALEHFHKNVRSDADDKSKFKKIMKHAFQKQRSEMEKNGDLSPEILLKARDLLKEYLDDIETNGIGSKIISLEDSFNISLNSNYGITGFVDRLDLDNDGIYHIKDYKTSKNKKYMEPFQLQTYGIYLLNKFPEVDHFRGSYVMLRFNGSLISYDFNKADVEKTKRDLIKYGDQITEEERWMSKTSVLCDWCDFKQVCHNSW
jgi:putative RecB family exonuclease